MPAFPVPHHLPGFAQVHVQWIDDAIQPCHPLSPSSPFALNLPQHQGLFQWVSCSHQVAKAHLASASVLPRSMISFRIDWFDLFVVQGTLKSLLQHQRSKASILWHSAFFMAQLSHLYMTTGKTITLTIQTFVGKVMSLLFNTLSRFVIAFLPRSKPSTAQAQTRDLGTSEKRRYFWPGFKGGRKFGGLWQTEGSREASPVRQ